MTNRNHQTAAAHPTPPDAPRGGPSNVVDLVTTSRNLKTEDLKTVTPKKQTVFSTQPHFWCNSVGSVLGPLTTHNSVSCLPTLVILPTQNAAP
jgi:hypothetical protein